jgi:hypothetical protein
VLNKNEKSRDSIPLFNTKMGGQVAFGFYDDNTKLISYYFMGDYAINDLKTYLLERYNVLFDIAQTMFEGKCTLKDYKSQEFQEEHDLVAAVVIMPDSIVCYDHQAVTVMRKRTIE